MNTAPDYSKMSDAELMALVQPKSGPWDKYAEPAKGPWDNYSHLAGMSDADLLKLAKVDPADMTDKGRAAHAAANPGVAADITKSVGIGVAKGPIAFAGGAGDLRTLLSRGTDYLAPKLGVDPETVKSVASKVAGLTPTGSILRDAPTSRDIQGAIETQTGEFYQPKTRAGKYTEAVSSTLANPGSYLGPGGLPAKLVTGTTSALGSEAAGQYTEGTKAEPYARIAGALIGSVAPTAAARAITPIPASTARQRLVDVLADEGVTSLTAGQRTGSKGLQYAESILGDFPGAGQGATRIQNEGQRQFTEAAMRRAGAGPDATPEVLAQNSQRLGNEFERLSAANNLTPDNQFITDLTAAVRNYRRVPDSQQRQMVQGYVDDIIDHVNAGSMPGPQYQEMRSRLSRQANNLRNSDPTLSEALRDMRNALDDAMGRSINPADQQAWQTARREYGAQRTIEKSASKAGEGVEEGQLVPSSLRNTASAENRGAYARGEGPFSELARAGSGIMKPLPNSGTSQRATIQSIISALGGGAGAGIAGVPGAIGGAAAAAAAPGVAGRILMARPTQAYLGNQLLTPLLERAPSIRAAIARALLTAPGVR